MCSLGFCAGWIFKDPFVKLLLGDYKSTRIADTTESSLPHIPLTPVQEEFWAYLEQFNHLPENPTKEMIAVYNAKGIAPEFHYLKASKTSVFGDISGLIQHSERFVKRYPWVQPLLDQYSIVVPISTIRFSGTAKEIGEKYGKLMRVSHKCKNTPDNEKTFVRDFLEGLLVVDYIYACGTKQDKQEGMIVFNDVFRANLVFHPFKKNLVASLHAPASRDIGWAIIANSPERIFGMTSALIGSGFAEYSPADKVNFHKWMLRTKGISEMESENQRHFHQAMIHNEQVRIGLISYAIYSIHCYEVVRPSDAPGLIVTKILFKRLVPKDYPAQYERYLTLLNTAYPKINS